MLASARRSRERTQVIRKEARQDMVEQIGRQRAEFGAVQNRLESTVNNLSNVAVNVSAGQSRIRDADFAKEASDLLRAQILERANVAVMSQANQISRQTAVQLLGGPK